MCVRLQGTLRHEATKLLECVVLARHDSTARRVDENDCTELLNEIV